MSRAGDLPLHSYEQGLLVVELIKRLGSFITLILLLATGILAAFGSLLAPWSVLDHDRKLRWFVVSLAVVVAWPLTTYGYNYLFDQGHFFDRLLLLALLPLLWWRPVFVFPFLLLATVLMGQLAGPVPMGSILEHKLQVIRVLQLFAACFLLHAITSSKRTDVFLLVACCLVAAAYWLPALAKFQLGWVMHGQIYHVVMSAYGHGWMGQFRPEQIVSFAEVIALFDWPMRFFVLFFEGAFLFFLLNRSFSLFLLAAIVVFHLGVFVLMGFLFWTWIVLDLALFALLWSDREKKRLEIYGRHYLVLSLAVILASDLWAGPPRLAWFDTRVAYTYRVDGVTESGQRYRLPPRYFTPYEDVFAMTTFSFLAKDHTVLTGPYGVTHRGNIAQALSAPLTAQELFQLEQELPGKPYNSARSGLLGKFIVEYVSNRNSAGKWSHLTAIPFFPPQFWVHADDSVFDVQEPIREVVITELTWLYDDNRLEVVREQEMERYPIVVAP